MAQVWQCDRCDVVSKDGNVDDPPEDWVTRSLPIRGSEGARSSMDSTLCTACDDLLYKWFYYRQGGDDSPAERNE